MPRGPAALPAPAFGSRLQQEGLPAVLVLAGAEAWFREQCLGLALKWAFPDGDPGGGLVRMDAALDGARGVLDDVRSSGLFASRRVVVVERAEQVEAQPGMGDGRQAALTRLVLAVAPSLLAPSHLILLTGYGVKGRQSVSTDKLLGAGAWVVDCRALYDAPAPWERSAPYEHELSRFLVERMKRVHGKRLGLEDAHALCLRVGPGLAELDDALRGLALYVADRAEIRAQDIEAAVGVTREEAVFGLADRVLDGEVDGVLAALDGVFERGLSGARGDTLLRPEALFPVLCAALYAGYRRMLLAAEALERGEPGAEVAKAQGVPPFRAEAFLARARRPSAQLLELHGAFLEAEMGAKGGGVPPRIALERLVITLVSALAPSVPPRA